MLIWRRLRRTSRGSVTMKHVVASLLCAVSVTAAAPHAWAQVAPPSPAPPPAAPSTPPASAATDGHSAIIERVLVRVNGEIFTQSQLTNRQIGVLRELKESAGSTTNLEAELSRLTPDILVRAIDQLLIAQHGRELGITFNDDQFKSAVENIKKQNKLDDDGLRRAMQQEGMTMDELRQNIEFSYLEQGVQQREIGPSMTITLEEQRQYYKRHGDRFMTPLTVTLRELSISVPTQTQNGKEVSSVADDNDARTRIDGLRTRALGGEDFAALVSANSDSATKASGGLIGPVNVSDLSDALKDVVSSLEPGGVSEPIRTTRGYQIFKLETRSVPELHPFDDVRREIENAIRNERLEPETQKLLTRLRSQAVIEWKDESLRQIYEKRVAETTTAAADPS